MKLFNFFKKKQPAIIGFFKVGQVIQMSKGYHTKNPYYVEIVYYNENARNGETIMETSIPMRHKLRMVVGNNWEYHRKRMTIIGDKSEFEHLLYRQRLQ